MLAIDRYPAVCPFAARPAHARPDLVKFTYVAQEIAHGNFASATHTEHLCHGLLAECNALIRGEGLDPHPLWAEVHRANMSKLDLFGNPIRDVRGKVQKGPNYTPPDIAGVLRAMGHDPARAIDARAMVQGFVR
jgi:predicted HAD superfamily Cof-like phosphohydrolase